MYVKVACGGTSYGAKVTTKEGTQGFPIRSQQGGVSGITFFLVWGRVRRSPPSHRPPRQKLGVIDSRFLLICVDFCRNALTYVEKCLFLPELCRVVAT